MARPVILVVDDDPGVRESFRLILEDHYDVLDVPDGPRALDVASASQIDLVLLDIRLPGMDGIEVLERIKAIDEGIEVILVTAVKTVRTAVAAMKLGAFDYLTKPFEEEELLSRARRARRPRARDRRVARRVRALRSRARRVHRRPPPQARAVRAGAGRHALPGRDRRAPGRAPGQALTRAPGARDGAGRRHARRQDRRPGHRGDQHQPEGRGAARGFPRGSLLSPQRRAAGGAAPA